MEVKAPDCEALLRAAYLLASLDRARFSAEQQEVIDNGIKAAESMRARMENYRERQRSFMAEKRKADPTYGQTYTAKKSVGKPKGRPKKEKE